MTAMSRARVRSGLVGLAMTKVNRGPIATSTPTVIGRTDSMSARYQPGQRYQPRYSAPTIRPSRQLLAKTCQPSTLIRYFMKGSSYHPVERGESELSCKKQA